MKPFSPKKITLSLILTLTKHLMIVVALFLAVLRLSELIWPWTTYLTVQLHPVIWVGVGLCLLTAYTTHMHAW